MIARDLRGRGIKDERLLDAFRRVDRARFVPEVYRKDAYEDRPLHLTHGQTISQPYIVAVMTDRLKLTGTEKVLEIGTGSGWQTALLAELAREVWTVERLRPLAERAKKKLRGLGCKNIKFIVGDGSLGQPEGAPFDRILAAAGGPRLPSAWKEQLAEGGRLVAPVGPPDDQYLVTAVKHGGKLKCRRDLACRFVLLLGEAGFAAGTKLPA